MLILLNTLSITCTSYAIEVKCQLAQSVSKEELINHLGIINRDFIFSDIAIQLPEIDDISVIVMLLRTNNYKNCLWVYKQLDSVNFKLTYHHKEVVIDRSERRNMQAKQCFAANKKRMYTLALFDLMHIFNSPNIKKHCNPCDVDCQDLRFNFTGNPITIEFSKLIVLQRHSDIKELLDNTYPAMQQLIREMRARITQSVLDDAYVKATSTLTPIFSVEMILTLKTLHTELEGLLIGYLERQHSRSASYELCLNSLTILRKYLTQLILNNTQSFFDDITKYYESTRNRAFAFLAAQHDTPFIVKAEGLPLADQGWPHDRELSNIEKLHTPQSSATLLGNTPNTPIHFADMIPSNESTPIIVDIGAGTGRGLNDLREMLASKNIKAKCVAVGVTPLKPEYEKNMHAIFYTSIPDAKLLLDHFEGVVDLVIETYGASTYASHPLKALAYIAKLLRPCGKYRGLISGVQRLPDGTPTGFVLTRLSIEAFFKELGYEVTIHETMIRSQVTGFENTTMADYLIFFEKPSVHQLCSKREKSFAELCALIDVKFGQPVKYQHRNEFGKFAKFTIHANVFNNDITQLDTRNLLQFGLLSYFMESDYIEGGPQLRYAFDFMLSKNASIFLQKFLERFRYRGRDDWLAEIDANNPTLVLLSFCPLAERIAYYDKKYKEGMLHGQIVQSETVNNEANKQKWMKMWTDANNQLFEYYDIPCIHLALTADASFIIPSVVPPHRITYSFEEYTPQGHMAKVRCDNTATNESTKSVLKVYPARIENAKS